MRVEELWQRSGMAYMDFCLRTPRHVIQVLNAEYRRQALMEWISGLSGDPEDTGLLLDVLLDDLMYIPYFGNGIIRYPGGIRVRVFSLLSPCLVIQYLNKHWDVV